MLGGDSNRAWVGTVAEMGAVGLSWMFGGWDSRTG